MIETTVADKTMGGVQKRSQMNKRGDDNHWKFLFLFLFKSRSLPILKQSGIAVSALLLLQLSPTVHRQKVLYRASPIGENCSGQRL